MPVTWQRRHFDPGAEAYDGEILVGQVARYDRVKPGTVERVGVFYVGFVRGEPVSGECETFDAAVTEVERACLAGGGQRLRR